MSKLARYVILAAFMAIAGSFWSHFPIWRLVALEIVRPCLASMLICALWPNWTPRRKLSVSALAVIVIQAVSSVSYGFNTGSWYIYSDGDGETRLFMLICLCIDLIVISAVVSIEALFRSRATFDHMKTRIEAPNQPPQRNAGGRPSSSDPSVSEPSSSLGPRG